VPPSARGPDDVAAPGEPLAGGGYHEGEELVRRTVAPGGLRDVEYDRCRFVECVFESAQLRRVVFLGCEFVDCDLSLATFIDCRAVECRLIGCRALGVTWTGLERSLVARVPFAFERCRLDLGSFRGADVSGSVFTDCSLREVDFTDARLRGADLTHADVGGATFLRTDLTDAVLVDATNLEIDPRHTRLTGATFSVDGALALLAALGVVVR
jgi:fluoroquinolone resistance protein